MLGEDESFAATSLPTLAAMVEEGLGITLLPDLAIAAGATVLSHVNDSGFWLVSRFFGMDVKTTLRTWTVMETTLGLAIFLLACLIWVVVP